MNSHIIYFLALVGIFVIAFLCMLLSMWFPRSKVMFSFLTALFSEIGMIFAFIIGATLQELLIPFLGLLWISLHACFRKEGEKK